MGIIAKFYFYTHACDYLVVFRINEVVLSSIEKTVQIIHHCVGGIGVVYPGVSYPFNIDNVKFNYVTSLYEKYKSVYRVS